MNPPKLSCHDLILTTFIVPPPIYDFMHLVHAVLYLESRFPILWSLFFHQSCISYFTVLVAEGKMVFSKYVVPVFRLHSDLN